MARSPPWRPRHYVLTDNYEEEWIVAFVRRRRGVPLIASLAPIGSSALYGDEMTTAFFLVEM